MTQSCQGSEALSTYIRMRPKMHFAQRSITLVMSEDLISSLDGARSVHYRWSHLGSQELAVTLVALLQEPGRTF